MGKRLFVTIIKKDHKLGDNEYVKGRITGINYVVSGCPEIPFATAKDNRGDLLLTKCYPRQYRKFKKIVQEMYPGLCIFDYDKNSLIAEALIKEHLKESKKEKIKAIEDKIAELETRV